MPNSWNVTITAPNGAKTDFAMDAGEDEQKILDFFAQTLRQAIENDPEPFAGTPGLAPAAQPRRQP